MTVSAVLIVKDGARTLDKCLASLAGSVDEIVVVDTGSTDATRSIAHAHGARVVDWAWRDDFAAARQFAFDQATSEWVFWLDADDVMIGGDWIRPAVDRAPADVAGFYWRYILARDARGVPTHASWRERCVRNTGTFRWVGRVHEVLVSQTPVTIVKDDRVVVEHHPDATRVTRGRRNQRILEEMLAASDGRPEPRLLFYLGREYADHGDVPRAIETLQRYIAVSQWDDERYLAKIQIADLLRSQGRYAEALDADLAATRTHERWPDAYFGLAASNYFLRDWPKVIEWLRIGRSLPHPDTMLFVNARKYEFDWIIYYTSALYHLDRIAGALIWTEKALAIAPDDPWHRHNLEFFTGRLHALETTPDRQAMAAPTT